MHSVAGLVTLTLALAFYLHAEGLLEIIPSFQIRPRQGGDGCCSTVSGR
ncbi:MAG TPA: hypothetical protein VGT24_01260 [Candidatus Acidoferrales bacterium]|nr:hypothetical protein [Candidatus Acidoferrales bacterium]